MRSWVATTPLLLSAVLGCSATVVDEDEAVGAADARSQGSVSVQRTVTLTGAGDAGRVTSHVSARFVQVDGGIDHDFAERVVGNPRDLPPTESCEWRSPTSLDPPLPASPSAGSIELLDVGDVVLHVGARSMELAPRAFPDVGEIISGVLYTSRDHNTELPPDAVYEIETTGSDVADGFRLSVDAPPAPQELRVGAHDLDSAELAVPLGQALQLQWLASQQPGDRIIIDLVPVLTDGRQPGATRCSFDDDGTAVVPADFVSWSPEFDELDLSIHRVRRAVLKVPAVDEAVVEFDFAVVARLAVAPVP